MSSAVAAAKHAASSVAEALGVSSGSAPPPPPRVLLFDVNETLSDMSLMGGHFASVGAPSHLAPLWFAHTLRDGLALAALGQQAEFSAIAKDTLRVLLTSPDVQGNLNRSVDAAIAHILEGFQSLPLHNDVAPAMRALKAAGFTLATLSNGSASNAEKLLSSAEVRDCFTTILSVEDAAAPRTGWKPARSTYEYAAAQLGCPLSDMLLVAVHPWDLQGGHQAGLQTAFIDRRAAAHGGIPTPFPSHFAAPTYTASSMNELYQQLTRAKKE